MTYLCEDSRSSERTSRENVESCGCGADESGEHCGLWEKKWGKRGGGGMSRCRIYICKVRTRNGNQTPSVGNQPRINKSQAPHILPALSLWRQGPPPGDVISNCHHHALNMGYYLRTTTVFIYICLSVPYEQTHVSGQYDHHRPCRAAIHSARNACRSTEMQAPRNNRPRSTGTQ